ncbi:TlpA disulfide reductase family protein [Pseudonocardia zijingensis]|jgi:thiol-disulfide isomerase/thioredoxin|uniref:TlpA disulfide reductase family protein n=1 Tax=Pseudonocardia zijingensis TaxID=153376 RepID=A0ABN1NDC6_9PSEU
MIRLLAAVLAALLLAGCSATKDAVATGGEFQFVAPGGQTTILYDPPESRGTVPRFSGESLQRDGATVGLDDHRGKVVIVNIWGSWCGPCREEMPGLQFVQDQTGAAVLGIDVRDERQAAADFVRDRGITFDSIFDPPGRVLARLSGYPRNTVPSTLVLDEQHRVAAVFLTQVRVPELMPLVQRLQAEPPPTA